MGKEYLKLDEEDYEKLVDFINYVFSHSGGKRIFHPYCLRYKIYWNHGIAEFTLCLKMANLFNIFPQTMALLKK